MWLNLFSIVFVLFVVCFPTQSFTSGCTAFLSTRAVDFIERALKRSAREAGTFHASVANVCDQTLQHTFMFSNEGKHRQYWDTSNDTMWHTPLKVNFIPFKYLCDCINDGFEIFAVDKDGNECVPYNVELKYYLKTGNLIINGSVEYHHGKNMRAVGGVSPSKKRLPKRPGAIVAATNTNSNDTGNDDNGSHSLISIPMTVPPNNDWTFNQTAGDSQSNKNNIVNSKSNNNNNQNKDKNTKKNEDKNTIKNKNSNANKDQNTNQNKNKNKNRKANKHKNKNKHKHYHKKNKRNKK